MSAKDNTTKIADSRITTNQLFKPDNDWKKKYEKN